MLGWSVTIRKRISQSQWYPWFIFFSVTTGTFMVNLDSSVLNVAFPALLQTFDAKPSVIQWVITSYLLVITAIVPTIGKLSDRLGRKPFFIAGISIFTFGSIMVACSVSLGMMIAFRIVQGIGASMIMGNVMAIIADTFPPGQRGKPLGVVGSIVAAGTIAGPGVGGIIIEHLSWRAIFFMNVPVGLLSVLMAFILLPASKKSKKSAEPFDVLGAVFFFVAVACLLVFCSNGYTWGWTSWNSLMSIGLSAAAWIAFIKQEKRTIEPLIDLSLFRNIRFTIGNITCFISFLLMMVPSMLLPIYFTSVLSISIGHVGVIMMLQAVATIVVAPVGGWVADRYGTFRPSILGLSLVACSLWMLTRLGTETSVVYAAAAILLFGCGLGFFQSPNNIAVLENAPSSKTGVTGGIMAVVRNFGRVIGVSVSVLVYQLAKDHVPGGADAEAVPVVFWMALFIALFAVALVAGGMRKRSTRMQSAD